MNKKVVDINSKRSVEIKLSFWDKIKILFLTLWYIPKRRFDFIYREKQIEKRDLQCAQGKHLFIIPDEDGIGKHGNPYEYRRCKNCKCKSLHWITFNE